MKTGWRRNLAAEKLSLYPMNENQMLPTRFGNALRSFESYGKTRFNLDSQPLWNELCAVTPKYIQDELDWSRASVDFFVACIYLSAIFGVTTLVIGAYEGQLSVMLLAIPAFLLTLICHWFVVRVVRNRRMAWQQALVNNGPRKRPKSVSA